MFLPIRPNIETINRFLKEQHKAKFSYEQVGATRYLPGRDAPEGYTLDHNRALLGKGQTVFADSVAALCAWRMFATRLTKIYPFHAPIEVGQTVAVLARHFGFWSLNACRVVYLIDEAGEIERRGFAYGTLDEHAEQGEERFLIERHLNTDEVWYDLLAFSSPKHIMARIGYPVSRMLQKSFARESKAAMLAAANMTDLEKRWRL